jgi:acetyl-CoA acetyltransferase
MSRKSAPVRITGIGHTDFSRRSGRSVRTLACEAASLAVADADLALADIDAVIPVGGSVLSDDLISGLGLRTSLIDCLPPPGGNSGVLSLELAEIILRSGRASTVLIVFARNGSSAARVTTRSGTLPGQQFRTYLERPHGWVTPAQWYTMMARRHELEFGSSKKAMAEVALTSRAHAQLNPGAMMHRRELTREMYDTAPYITDLYQRFDCCLETDGAVALLLSAPDGPAGSRPTAVELLAVESARPQSPDELTNRDDWLTIGLTSAAPAAYERAGLGPRDLDGAMIYDCFTFEVLHQLEAGGFCPPGGSSEFVLSGAIRLGGALPVNTHGGMLSDGHLGGVSHVLEAVRQLRHEAGARQIDDAQVIGVTGWGDWGDGSMAILGRKAG